MPEDFKRNCWCDHPHVLKSTHFQAAPSMGIFRCLEAQWYMSPVYVIFLRPLIGPQIKWWVRGLSLINLPSLPQPTPWSRGLSTRGRCSTGALIDQLNRPKNKELFWTAYMECGRRSSSGLLWCTHWPTHRALKTKSCSRLHRWKVHTWEVFNW